MSRRIAALVILALVSQGCVGLMKVGGGPITIGQPKPTPTATPLPEASILPTHWQFDDPVDAPTQLIAKRKK